jgi:hypothetical protein
MHRRLIPNAITIARLCFLPVFVWVYSRQAIWREFAGSERAGRSQRAGRPAE